MSNLHYITLHYISQTNNIRIKRVQTTVLTFASGAAHVTEYPGAERG